MSKVRAKFSCKKIEPPFGYGEDEKGRFEILLTPVLSGSPENRDFYRWTPSGEIRLGVVTSKTANAFEVGRDYYVDFTPAPELES